MCTHTLKVNFLKSSGQLAFGGNSCPVVIREVCYTQRDQKTHFNSDVEYMQESKPEDMSLNVRISESRSKNHTVAVVSPHEQD